jgi:hypothetical protein
MNIWISGERDHARKEKRFTMAGYAQHLVGWLLFVFGRAVQHNGGRVSPSAIDRLIACQSSR